MIGFCKFKNYGMHKNIDPNLRKMGKHDIVIRNLMVLMLLIMTVNLYSQENSTQPKLVVGIVVDQMRFDHLYKYESKYSEEGFKRLMREGFNFKNTHYNYVPTVTAAGHASIYTGTTPSVHGIIGNSWYMRKNGKDVVNVEDPNVKLVGSAQENIKGFSPINLLTTTISDQLRSGTNFNSKVISISIKDRGAILPGGHTANAAYWHDYQSSPGHFVTSSYYMDELPEWVNEFNSLDLSNKYIDTTWETLLPIEDYTESSPDNNEYEYSLGGKASPTFPYDLKNMRNRYKAKGTEYQLLWASPGGNKLLTDFAKEAIKNEKLGMDEHTDLLAISYSTPDVAGHTFGQQSVEIEDIYLRLDRDLADLLKYLDSSVGKGNYLLFLTSDHGAIPNVSYLDDNKLPAELAQINDYYDQLSQYLNDKYGPNQWVEYFSGEQLYLNHKLISEKKKINLADMRNEVAGFMNQLDGVRIALTADQLMYNDYSSGLNQMIQNGFYPKRSGDVILSFEPGFIPNLVEGKTVTTIKGTTHGSAYNYDTHVPLLWFGTGIKAGESVRKVFTIDVAPSLSMFLNVQLPSGATGLPLYEIHK